MFWSLTAPHRSVLNSYYVFVPVITRKIFVYIIHIFRLFYWVVLLSSGNRWQHQFSSFIMNDQEIRVIFFGIWTENNINKIILLNRIKCGKPIIFHYRTRFSLSLMYFHKLMKNIAALQISFKSSSFTFIVLPSSGFFNNDKVLKVLFCELRKFQEKME